MSKKFTSEFKAKVAIEALKGQKTINEISAEYGVHPTQVVNWKKLLLDGSKDVFSGKNERNVDHIRQERDRLYTQIGQMAVELDWLKKKTGYLG